MRPLAIALVVLCVAGSAATRLHLAFSDPGFDRERPERVLKSDPALLIYLTGRILEAGGGVPEDFRADPRIEHPEPTDVPAMFTVGEEFLLAWTWRAFGGGLPLHVFSVYLWSLVASLAGLGVFGAARELTRSDAWGVLAVVLWAAAPASYRTAGMVILREDLSLPLFALHAALLLRAARVGGVRAHVLAGLPLLLALATWHAMTFVVAVEAACLFVWMLRTGRSPLRADGAWAGVAVVAVGSLAIPVLRAKGFLLSPAAMLMAAMALAAWLDARGAPRAARAGGAIALALLLAGLARWLAAEGLLADYSHVFDFMLAKVRTLGVRPDDPLALSFETRLLWQGPFETPAPSELLAGFTVGAVLAPAALLQGGIDFVRGRASRATGVLLFTAAFLLLALLVRRNLAIATLAVPIASVVLLARTVPSTPAVLAVGLAAAQLFAAAAILPTRQLRWYFPDQQDELAAVVKWAAASLPPDAAVASDFVNGPALLADHARPITLQPKYETRRSRDRAQVFLHAVFHEDPAALAALLRSWDARYLLVDRETLWQHRYMAGLPEALAQPTPGTAAAAILSRDGVRLEHVPGFVLRYRSPLPTDLMRVFEVR